MSRAARSKRVPTEDSPELGVIELFDITLSEGERWEQDGYHVFRSTEFDVVAAGATFEDGLRAFGNELLRFGAFLAMLEDPAENEAEMLKALQPHSLSILERAKAFVDETEQDADACEDGARSRRPRTATRARRTRDHSSRWQPTSGSRRSSARRSRA